jgi:hypothetical protein
MESGVLVTCPPEESVAVAVTLDPPEAVGVQVIVAVLEDMHPVGNPAHLKLKGPTPYVGVAVKLVVWARSTEEVEAATLTVGSW